MSWVRVLEFKLQPVKKEVRHRNIPSHYRKRKITVMGKTFESVKDCLEETGLTSYRLYQILKSQKVKR